MQRLHIMIAPSTCCLFILKGLSDRNATVCSYINFQDRSVNAKYTNPWIWLSPDSLSQATCRRWKERTWLPRALRTVRNMLFVRHAKLCRGNIYVVSWWALVVRCLPVFSVCSFSFVKNVLSLVYLGIRLQPAMVMTIDDILNIFNVCLIVNGVVRTSIAQGVRAVIILNIPTMITWTVTITTLTTTK